MIAHKDGRFVCRDCAHTLRPGEPEYRCTVVAGRPASALASSSRARVRNRRSSFQRRPNPGPLLSAQRRELKSVLCS